MLVSHVYFLTEQHNIPFAPKIYSNSNLFRKVFEVIELMKLDMANFTLQQARPLIQKHAVEYERAKFEDFLKVQQGTVYSVSHHFTKSTICCRNNINVNGLSRPIIGKECFSFHVENNLDGLQYTKEWLRDSFEALHKLSQSLSPSKESPSQNTAAQTSPSASAATAPKVTSGGVITHAYVQLLIWPDTKPLPEVRCNSLFIRPEINVVY